MSGWKLGLDGFVTHFMVSGPQDRRRTRPSRHHPEVSEPERFQYILSWRYPFSFFNLFLIS
mgnify:CR=1 FL=1